MLRSLQKLKHPSPQKFIGCFNEVLNAALKAEQARDLMEEEGLVSFLKRFTARLYGFSSLQTYLVLASLVRAPRASPVGDAIVCCLEQLQEGSKELADTSLTHLGLLLAQLGGPGAGEAEREATRAFWTHYSEELAARVPRLQPKELCMAAEALARGRPHCLAAVTEAVGAAATSQMDAFSPKQLSRLMYSLALLAHADADFFRASAARLGGMAEEELSPEHIGMGLLALATAGLACAPQVAFALQQHSMTMVLSSSPSAALQTLRALCALRMFPAGLVLRLLGQVCRVPRTALTEAEDNGLHQVALSLKHEPAAGPSLAAVQAEPDLWESCYQPAEVIGEVDVNPGDREGVAELFAELATAHGWGTRGGALVSGFYRISLLVEAPASPVAVDIDRNAQSWLSSPADVWMSLKHRHLELWGYKVLWVNCREWLELDTVGRRRAAAQQLLCEDARREPGAEELRV